MTYGALQSDHPLILGPNAPSLQNIKAAASAEDLSRYARLRAPFCQRLADRVVGMADARGYFRKADLESVTILRTVGRLVTNMAGRETKAALPYLGVLVDHLQSLRDAGTVSDTILNPLAFLICSVNRLFQPPTRSDILHFRDPRF